MAKSCCTVPVESLGTEPAPSRSLMVAENETRLLAFSHTLFQMYDTRLAVMAWLCHALRRMNLISLKLSLYIGRQVA